MSSQNHSLVKNINIKLNLQTYILQRTGLSECSRGCPYFTWRIKNSRRLFFLFIETREDSISEVRKSTPNNLSHYSICCRPPKNPKYFITREYVTLRTRIEPLFQNEHVCLLSSIIRHSSLFLFLCPWQHKIKILFVAIRNHAWALRISTSCHAQLELIKS